MVVEKYVRGKKGARLRGDATEHARQVALEVVVERLKVSFLG
ncbi:MAG TPA: hypothetical protein VMW16_10150 [Sedimentisphaerales bacterium]|nr:hypothetical protein [Sedimentisphaerales bacterium]